VVIHERCRVNPRQQHYLKNWDNIIDCQSEILLLLPNFPKGVDRREIGSVLGRNYSPGRITQALQELEVLRQILKVDEKYLISGPGEERISKVLSGLF
jgi:hypothetical protein